jgi:septum formation protein
LEGENGAWEIIGKADDEVHARATLSKLRGREHSVFTGIAVIDATTGEKRIEVEETRVTFRDFSDQVLESYVSSGDWIGKAGAYQILSIKDNLVQSIDGSVTNVIGLPLARVVGMLEEMGVQVDVVTDDVVWNEIGFKD